MAITARWRKRTSSRWLAGAMIILLATVPTRASQQAQAGTAGEPGPGEAEAPPPVETEFVASTIFQEATMVARLSSPLSLDAHWFGVEGNDIGVIGLSWNFAWRGLNLTPGLGWAFGRENRPAPVVTARWSYEHRRWLTEGLWVQSLKAHLPDHLEERGGDAAQEEVRYASVLDGVHASARLGRAELGPLVEHIQYREEREWKGGVRAAWLVARGVALVAQVLGPDAELRGGLAWER